MDVDPPQSRVFVVCGRAIEVGGAFAVQGFTGALRADEPLCVCPHRHQSDALEATFAPYGKLQNVKLIKDKGGGHGRWRGSRGGARWLLGRLGPAARACSMHRDGALMHCSIGAAAGLLQHPQRLGVRSIAWGCTSWAQKRLPRHDARLCSQRQRRAVSGHCSVRVLGSSLAARLRMARLSHSSPPWISFLAACTLAVAYVKYEKASSAAMAIENLNGAVLNNGRGPKLKVMLAEAPNAR